MKNSILLGISLSISLLLTLIVAADATDDIMSITFENITADASSVFPASLGFVVYAADTGKLLFTTSQVADNHEIMREIGGAGNYIVIRTQDPNWCTDLTLDECRRNAHFISETTFSLQEIPVDPPVPSEVVDIPSEDLWSSAEIPVVLPEDGVSLLETFQTETVSDTSSETETSADNESWTEPSIDSETSSDVSGAISAETSPAIVPETSSPSASSDTPPGPVPEAAHESAPETLDTANTPEIALPEESPEAQAWTPSSPLPEEPSPDPMPDEAAL